MVGGNVRVCCFAVGVAYDLFRMLKYAVFNNTSMGAGNMDALLYFNIFH